MLLTFYSPCKPDDKDAIIASLQTQLAEAKSVSHELEQQIRLRVSTFIHRETSARQIVESLEERLSKSLENDDDFKAKMSVLRSMHSEVSSSVSALQDSTAEALSKQERELMKGFRERFEEVNSDLDTIKNKKGELNGELQSRLKRLVTELQTSQTLAQALDRKNQILINENKNLTETLRTQVDDREALLKELINLKRLSKKTDIPPIPTIKTEEPPIKTISPPSIDAHYLFEREAQLRKKIADTERLLKHEKLQHAQLRNLQEGVMQVLNKCVIDAKLDTSNKTMMKADHAKILQRFIHQESVAKELSELLT